MSAPRITLEDASRYQVGVHLENEYGRIVRIEVTPLADSDRDPISVDVNVDTLLAAVNVLLSHKGKS